MYHSAVMPALVAGIHVFLAGFQLEDVDGRDKPRAMTPETCFNMTGVRYRVGPVPETRFAPPRPRSRTAPGRRRVRRPASARPVRRRGDDRVSRWHSDQAH